MRSDAWEREGSRGEGIERHSDEVPLQAREPRGEDASLSKLALDRDTPAVLLDDLLGDGEPETGVPPGIRPGGIDAIESFEQTRLMLRGDPNSRVGHANKGFVARGACRESDGSFGAIVGDSVAEKVEQNLTNLVRINMHLEC